MNQLNSLLTAIISLPGLSVGIARGMAFAGAVLQMTPEGQNVNWRAVGLAFLGGFLRAGEQNAPTK